MNLRFRNKYVVLDNGCWEWISGLTNGGYGRFWFDGKTRIAHKFTYEYENGKVPDGMVLDHICRNRKCVNPKHLEVVTQKENVNRGDRMLLKDACKKGHPMDDSNVAVWGGVRYCKTCNADRSRNSRNKK